jgi:DNA-binding beta-propeller fold protein YncE
MEVNMKEVVRKSPIALAAAVVVLVIGMTGTAGAINPKPIATGLSGAIGAALDEVNGYLYFVDYVSGELRRLELNPDCLDLDKPDLCPMDLVVGGFSHPEDVALNVAAGLAYVTTRDAPGSGALYRVDIAANTKTLVTFNMGAPHQIAIRPTAGKAYTVSYNDGRLREIDLITGAKIPLLTGLDHPVGLVVTNDDRFALVSEQGASNQITMIDLALGAVIPPPVATGLTAPFYMSWADGINSSVYIAERNPLNQVTKVDLSTGTPFPVFSGLPLNPSAAVVNNAGNLIYITTNNEILVGSVGIDPTLHPDLMGIGHLTVTEIDRFGNGYANSDDGYYQNAPFGGTLSIFANLTNFHAGGGAFYRLNVSKNGGPFDAVAINWSTKKWDPTPPKGAYKPITVMPVSGQDYYEIPVEYTDGRAAWWYHPFQIIKYPTAENGIYQLELEVLNGAALVIGTYSLQIRVDNLRPEADIHNIYQCNGATCTTEVFPCDIVNGDFPRFSTSNEFAFKITARDNEGHLRRYRLYGMYGDNQHTDVVFERYRDLVVGAAPGPYAPILWHGPKTEMTAPKALTCNCAYTFYLYAWSRTTNGWGYLHKEYVDYHKSFTLNHASTPVQPWNLPSCYTPSP